MTALIRQRVWSEILGGVNALTVDMDGLGTCQSKRVEA
jgi:hypothetical protein